MKTMTVKLLQPRCGHGPGGIPFGQAIGQEVEVDEADGNRMISAGQATWLSGAAYQRPPIPTAAVETASIQQRSRGGAPTRAAMQVNQ